MFLDIHSPISRRWDRMLRRVRMNQRNRVLLFLSLCLALPVPVYAMIELLPAAFATLGILLIILVVPIVVQVKRSLLALRFPDKPVVPWKRLCIVTVAEGAILGCAFLLFFVSMESWLVPNSGRAIMAVTFTYATILYSLIAVMPNLWLLSALEKEFHVSRESQRPSAFAWLLSLPFPFVLLAEVLTIYALML